MAAVTWRPAAASVRNLGVLWSSLAVSAAVTSLVRASQAERRTIAAVVALALAGAIVLASTWGTARVHRALRDADEPRLVNWPPSRADAHAQQQASRRDAVRVSALAVVVGVAVGAVPVVGAVVASAAAAGAAGSWIVRTTISAFERHHDVTVLLPSRADLRRAPRKLLFGLAPAATPTSTV